MNERLVYDILLWSFVGLGAVIFIALFFISAPYGRHTRGGWGPLIPARWGWVLMESVSSLGFLGWYLAGDPARRASASGVALLVIWEIHYAHRAFIYPFRRRGGHKGMPFSVVSFGMIFNLWNTYLNARWLYELGPGPSLGLNVTTIAGLLLFAAGFAINQHADAVLTALRAPADEEGYKIPRGGMYRFISCPNYFGEIVEWIGWAVLTWSLAGAAFAFWTIGNLAPRALSHHRWYQAQFADYPKRRRALVPFLF